jgi:DNA sulfur modification protein DndB
MPTRHLSGPSRILQQSVVDTSVTSAPSKTRRAPRRSGGRRASKVAARAEGTVHERRFAAVRAVQAQRAYFVTACPLRLVSEILSFDSLDLPPQLRAQRVLTKARVPQIARYLTSNPTSYVLSAITASIDADVHFEPQGLLQDGVRIGELTIPATARLLVNDGQHRRAAIAQALQTAPELANESVPLVLFLDAGLSRSQQIFADLNRHGIRPTTSLNVLYDHRDWIAKLARKVAAEIRPFEGLTELEKSSLSNRSSMMFTLSGIHQATKALFRNRRDQQLEEQDEALAMAFWEVVGELISTWGVIACDKTAAELRREYLHVHAVALHALGMVGGELVQRYPTRWRVRLRRLMNIDWARSNPLWDGRAIHNGRISKAGPSLILTANVLRARAGLELSPTERDLENTLPKEHRVQV